MTLHRAISALALTTVALAAGPAVAQAKTETDSEGVVKASFRYTANKDKTQFKNLKVDIQRNGALLLRTTLPKYKDFWPGGVIDDSSVDVRDLDGDGEPEVMVKLYSGGANCCLGGLVFSYNAATNGYRSVFRDYGRYGYTVKQLDGKGPLELVTADIRFSSAFSTVTATERSPVRILQFVKGRFVDVTRANPVSLRKDLKELRKDYPAYVKGRANRKGILASIAADQLLLNDQDGVVKTFQKIQVLYGNEFTKRLKLFLARRGYKLQN